MDTEFQGLAKGIFGTESFMLKLIGNGNVFVNAYGGIVKREIKDGERIVVDNYHLVAMDDNTIEQLRQARGRHSYQEGIGIEVVGPSTLYIQSRSEREIKDEFIRLLELDKLRGSNRSRSEIRARVIVNLGFSQIYNNMMCNTIQYNGAVKWSEACTYSMLEITLS